MARYYQYLPNGMLYGASMKIRNTSNQTVTNLYGDAGLFITFGGVDGDNNAEMEFPLVTLSDSNVTEIPAGATVWITNYLPAPVKPQQQCRLAVDSTSLPSTCMLTPVVHVGMWQNEVKGTVV